MNFFGKSTRACSTPEIDTNDTVDDIDDSLYFQYTYFLSKCQHTRLIQLNICTVLT